MAQHHGREGHSHHGEHAKKGEKQELGWGDLIIGAVLFVAVCTGLFHLLGVAVPGLLSETTLREILKSGFVFFLVWALLGNVILKPFLHLVYEREARTVGDEKAATERKKECALLEEQVGERLREARLEGIRERDRILETAKKRADELVAAAQRAAAERLEISQQEVVDLKQQAKRDLAKEAGELADAVISRVLVPEPRHALH